MGRPPATARSSHPPRSHTARARQVRHPPWWVVVPVVGEHRRGARSSRSAFREPYCCPEWFFPSPYGSRPPPMLVSVNNRMTFCYTVTTLFFTGWCYVGVYIHAILVRFYVAWGLPKI